MLDLGHLDNDTLKGVLESLLLVSSDAVAATDFAKVLGVAPGEVASALAELSAEYSDANRGFQLREVAGGWRLFTHPAYHEQVEKYVLSWDTRRLSQAALETLAVIAYHQPVTREGVKAVRGVNSDGVISSLKDKGLVREVGHEGERSRAILYGTTQRFLENFGLKSLRDLPPLEDFAPDEESKQFIRERLSGRAISSTLEETSADIDDERELLGDDLDGDDGSGEAAAGEGPAGDATAGEGASPDAVGGMLADALDDEDDDDDYGPDEARAVSHVEELAEDESDEDDDVDPDGDDDVEGVD
ncbi:MAG: SMC-Scp complex subunit ScpB [Olsenella sp.]|nr:SMC-Scp complex subunit ScpB [Olsenella sp.]